MLGPCVLTIRAFRANKRGVTKTCELKKTYKSTKKKTITKTNFNITANVCGVASMVTIVFQKKTGVWKGSLF